MPVERGGSSEEFSMESQEDRIVFVGFFLQWEKNSRKISDAEQPP